LFTLLDEIRLGEAFPFICFLELLSELVITHATSIDDGIRRQGVLRERELRKLERGGVGRRHTAAPRAAFCAAPPAT
jgi:hypothetical protein